MLTLVSWLTMFPFNLSICSYHRRMLIICSSLTRRSSEAEERCARGRAELDQVTLSLDGVHAMNSSLQSKLVLEKKTHEVTRQELQVDAQ
jgi:hypothetical protein